MGHATLMKMSATGNRARAPSLRAARTAGSRTVRARPPALVGKYFWAPSHAVTHSLSQSARHPDGGPATGRRKSCFRKGRRKEGRRNLKFVNGAAHSQGLRRATRPLCGSSSVASCVASADLVNCVPNQPRKTLCAATATTAAAADRSEPAPAAAADVGEEWNVAAAAACGPEIPERFPPLTDRLTSHTGRGAAPPEKEGRETYATFAYEGVMTAAPTAAAPAPT